MNVVNTVIRNLLSNAIKYTSGGEVRLASNSSGEWVEISVSDTGTGIEPKNMDKLFKIDAKYSTRGTAEEKGTGLGLILCKEFVERNGGTLEIESEPGKGSIFRFTLPADMS